MRQSRPIRRAVPLRVRLGCVNTGRIARNPALSYASLMSGALDNLEKALDALEAAIGQLEAREHSGGADTRLRAEVAEVIAELDAMLGTNRA